MALPKIDLSWFDKTRIESILNSGERFFLWTHLYGFVPTRIAPQLANGIAWHEAQDFFWREVKWNGSDPRSVVVPASDIWARKWAESSEVEIEDRDSSSDLPPLPREETPTYNRKRITKALEIYAEKFSARFGDFELLDIETFYELRFDSFTLCGRWDKPLRGPDGRIVIGEHKTTTSEDKTTRGFSQAWVDKWAHDFGTRIYAVAGTEHFGGDFGGVLVDGALTTANPDCLSVGPLEFDPGCLTRTRRDLETVVGRLDERRFPCNPNACHQWGRECPFVDLCGAGYELGDDVPEPEWMTQKFWNPKRSA